MNFGFSLLQRIIIRMLFNVNVYADVPLQFYLERIDLWTSDVTEYEIQSFSISHEILLRHTFIILNGLKIEKMESKKTFKISIHKPNKAKLEIEQWKTM
ncbi:unnamed protein product [Rotaria sp. Silwood2]|nr:unnamed protein product [Rotaria sp. Silwood2]CAF4189901.1 unnamed protein product [Rotaria sp. Silwood2]